MKINITDVLEIDNPPKRRGKTCSFCILGICFSFIQSQQNMFKLNWVFNFYNHFSMVTELSNHALSSNGTYLYFSK